MSSILSLLCCKTFVSTWMVSSFRDLIAATRLRQSGSSQNCVCAYMEEYTHTPMLTRHIISMHTQCTHAWTNAHVWFFNIECPGHLFKNYQIASPFDTALFDWCSFLLLWYFEYCVLISCYWMEWRKNVCKKYFDVYCHVSHTSSALSISLSLYLSVSMSISLCTRVYRKINHHLILFFWVCMYMYQ